MHYKSIKTLKVQYDEDDNHHVQSNAISHSGIILYKHG